jgi:hypothetical protein
VFISYELDWNLLGLVNENVKHEIVVNIISNKDICFMVKIDMYCIVVNKYIIPISFYLIYIYIIKSRNR